MSSLRNWWRGTPAPSSAKASASSSPADSSLGLNGSTSGSNAGENDDSNGNGEMNGKSSVEKTLSAAEREMSDVEDAMAAAGFIMNDDIDGAEARLRLRSDQSSFHQLGLGVATFVRSVLGFEKEIMAEAAARLAECEVRASADLKRAQKSAEKAMSGGSWFGGGGSSGADTAHGDGHASGRVSQIYPPGSEYVLVHAEAQLMNAILAVMHESLTEGIKGFYRMRKAFLALDGIMEAEARILKQNSQGARAFGGIPHLPRISDNMVPGSLNNTELAGIGVAADGDGEDLEKESDSDIEFVDAPERISGLQTPASSRLPPLSKSAASSAVPSGPSTPAVEKQLADLAITSSGPTPCSDALSKPSSPSVPLDAVDSITHPAASTLFTNPVDIFVHSGANMCFGMLLLLISLIPPAFSRLLYIIGFKGDRERGVRMLWRSTRFRNINGAIAGLCLLGYYNGLMSFADILPAERDVEELATRARTNASTGSSATQAPDASAEDDPDEEIVGYPRRRCAALLAAMRTQYPASGLWRLEEARELANSRRLGEAITTLRANTGSRMRQIVALNNFELSIDSMFALDWPLMRESFLRCVELSDWSHSMYYYMAGCAELEMYRDGLAAVRGAAASAASSGNGPDSINGGDGIVEEDSEKVKIEHKLLLKEALAHKTRAEEYLRRVPTVAGRKRFMSRQMPLEVFVCRKVAKLEERATALGLDLADAATAACPALEMIWLWNGSKRMGPEQLARARECLEWVRCTAPLEAVEKMKEEKDEMAVRAVCEASLLRRMGRLDEARAVLNRVVELDRAVFKGGNRDDYALPAAHYELAVVAWQEACDRDTWPEGITELADIDKYRREKLDVCQAALEKVAAWESFVLDARIGMRVQVGRDSVKWLKVKKGWS